MLPKWNFQILILDRWIQKFARLFYLTHRVEAEISGEQADD